MYRAAYEGHLGDTIAAILPCYWLYYEIGERLKECQPEEPIYNEWISAYGSDWFRTLVEEQITRLDTIAEKVTEADRKRMKQHFIISSQYEYSFWEMAYTLEKYSGYRRKRRNWIKNRSNVIDRYGSYLSIYFSCQICVKSLVLRKWRNRISII